MRKQPYIRIAIVVVASLVISLSFFQIEKVAALSDDSADVVTYLAKERNISIEEAQVRIGWQEKAGDLDEKLKKILPKADYGSLWTNKSNDKVNVGLVNSSVSSSASRQAIVDAIKTVGIGDGADIVSVTYPYSTLERTTEAIYKLYKANVGRDEWPIQVGTKTDLNKVQVDIPADSKNLTAGHQFVLSEIEKNYKDQVFFETYDEIPENQAQCNWWFCNSPLRGGVGIKGSVENFDNINCTAGFMVRGNATGNPYVLTAGHCAPAGPGWSTETYNYTNKPIGGTANSLFDDGTPIDAMIIQVRDIYNWGVTRKILKRSGDSNMGLNGYGPPSYDEAYDIQTYKGNMVNDRICISPAVTGGYATEPNGGSCGRVHQLNKFLTTKDGITTTVHRAGYCSRPGDSGAPIFASDYEARGIHKAADSSEVVCSDQKYYTPMSTIMYGFSSAGSAISIY